jgi:hypothetical protein
VKYAVLTFRFLTPIGGLQTILVVKCVTHAWIVTKLSDEF